MRPQTVGVAQHFAALDRCLVVGDRRFDLWGRQVSVPSLPLVEWDRSRETDGRTILARDQNL
jgi:hypothetical protein